MEDVELRPSSPRARSFWAGKRVLVTGHTGFKGSWLALWLQALGADVVGLSLDPPTTPSLFRQARVAEGILSLHGDIRDPDVVRDVMATHEPDIVFHLAAQSLVRASYRSPVETYATNVMGTVHVLEAMRQVQSARVGVIVTSDKCYENRESMLWGYREPDPMGGHDPYSNSKGCAELVAAAYRDSFFGGPEGPPLALATARAGNVIGGGDWAADRLVPDIVRAFADGRPVHIRRPDAVRPWQHVLEPLSGYLRLAERLWTDGDGRAGAWNFGPDEDDARPVGAVVEQMIERWGHGADAVLDDGPHPHEATYLRLDCSKARALLDWRPRLSLDEALAWTVEWYREVDRGADARALAADQIHRYQALHPDSLAHDLHEGTAP
jgi:CDP-glucose 4,6-dehydratase